MRRLLGSLVVALAVAAGAAGGGVPPGQNEQPRLQSSFETLEFVPGELLVRFKPGVSPSRQANALAQRDGRVERSLALPRLKLVRLPDDADVKAAAAALSSRPEVAYAEPNWLRRPDAVPNDTRFGELWGLHQTSDADIDAPEAWNVTTGSAGVIVAVVDTGVSYQHPDLAPNIWANDDPAGGGDDDTNGFVDDAHGWDFVQNDSTPFDYDSHGTHVAGTVGAQGNNTLGVTGVNWDVSIMVLRACCVNGQFPDSTIVNAFDYACDNGAKVVNGSFGSSNLGVAIRDAVLACPSVLFVFSAGNEGKDLDGSGAANDAYPCELHRPPTNAPNVLCVGATQEDDTAASFSNHGTQAVHLMAPGQAILSTWPAREPVPGTPVDTFETDIAGRWTPSGSWAWTAEASASPTHSITDSPGGNYANNANSAITRVDTIDLSGQIGCAVEYNLRLATQSGDFLRLDTSTDGVNWTQLIGWSGSSGGAFIPMADDVSTRDGTANVHFRYRLTSNLSGQADGAHVDDFAFACLDTDGEDYNAINGTSMSSPHVSGVAGLLLADDGTLTVSQLKASLTDNVDAMASLADKAISQGRLNACRALGGTDTKCGASPRPPDPVPPPPVDALDPTFGTDGVATAAFGDAGVFDTAFAVARQADGKLVMAGNSGGGVSFGSGGTFALARFDASGGLDSSFGGDGLVTTDFVVTAGKADEAHAVAIQPDGKIVAAGIADLGTGSTLGDWALARYDVDGSLDPTFGGGDGMVTTNVGHDNVWGVAIQGDGKIVAVGVASSNLAVVRYLENGNLDPAFGGGGGIVTRDLGGTSDEGRAVALQPDGKILVAGVAGPSTDQDFALIRLEDDGDFDPTFGGGDGIVTTELSIHPTFDNDRANALILQPDDMILLGGSSEASLPGGGVGGIFALARFDSSGNLDPGFSDDGKVTTSSISPTGSTSFINALGLQAGGKIVAAGDTANFDPETGFFHRDFALARYTADGNLDPTFDVDGKIVTQLAPPGQLDIIRGVVIQPDDKIVAAGYADMGPPEFVDIDFAIVRYQPDGDSFPPETTIVAGPSGATNDPTSTFVFSASESGTTFQCRVDSDPFAACTSPHTTALLPEGSHTFEARAIDSVGNPDPTPASRSFTFASDPGYTLWPEIGEAARDDDPCRAEPADARPDAGMGRKQRGARAARCPTRRIPLR